MSDHYCDCSGPRAPDGTCPVLYEARAIREGTAAQHYRQILSARVLERDGQRHVDVPYRLQKANAPMEAILALRQKRDTPAMDGAERFIQAPRAAVFFLLLVGKTGSGKTTAAVRVMQDYCRKYAWGEQSTGQDAEPLHFVPASRLTCLSVYGKDDEAWLQRLRALELLVLDDAGDEATATGLSLFVDLCVTRHALRKRTVITSNLTAEAFKTRYGEALADRIRSAGVIPNLSAQKSMRKAAHP